MAFANRRICIGPDHVRTILEDDGYTEISVADACPAICSCIVTPAELSAMLQN